ncbi:Reverse transcriptase domain [Cinara cedri]|uniref:Reverse transcriptase domain n=1 Tax=Cinara cedri TaxID=506608 RepID=A0A5E4M9V9_9HEMI|nr:Reverse transcriptase domain [Cinara cedri]
MNYTVFVPTVTNIAIFKQDILDSFSLKAQKYVIYTDFNKAFDQIDRNLLVLKLKITFCSNDPLLSWFVSCPSNRLQIVNNTNFLSTPIKASSGLPQGDHISPLLFLLYINDISTVLKHSNILLFADDAKMYKTVTSINDTLDLQSDLNYFCD